MDIKIHTIESAPIGSKVILKKINKGQGKILNHFGKMAESPATLNGYLSLHKHFDNSSFSKIEQQIIMLVVSYINNCDYCVAAHSTYLNAFKFPKADLDALRSGLPISDNKLETLRKFVVLMVEEKAWVGPVEIEKFISAGYTKENILEIITGIALKTISNYVNHVSNTPLDNRYKGFKWEKP